MTGQGGDSFVGGIVPDRHLVLGVSMGADEFVQRCAEGQVANLRVGVARLDGLACEDISEFYGPVSCPSS